METIKIDVLIHRGEKCISLAFAYNNTLTAIVKAFDNAHWSATNKAWLLADTAENRSKIKEVFKGKAVFEIGEGLQKQNKISPKSTFHAQQLAPEAIAKIEKFKQWLRSKRYSESTIGTYTDALKTFLRFYSGKPIQEITNDDYTTGHF